LTTKDALAYSEHVNDNIKIRKEHAHVKKKIKTLIQRTKLCIVLCFSVKKNRKHRAYLKSRLKYVWGSEVEAFVTSM